LRKVITKGSKKQGQPTKTSRKQNNQNFREHCDHSYWRGYNNNPLWLGQT